MIRTTKTLTHRISDGRATDAGRTQDLPAALPEVLRQGSDNAGLDDWAPVICNRHLR